jgi:hypothetical protein
MKLPISKISELTGVHRDTISKLVFIRAYECASSLVYAIFEGERR